MKLSKTLNQLYKGKYIKRKDWQDKYLKIVSEYFCIIEKHKDKYGRSIGRTFGIYLENLLNENDINANDWEIYER